MRFLLLTLAPLVSSTLMFVVYIPQVYLTFKTKNVKGQAKSFWTILSIILIGTVLQQIGMIAYLGANSSGLITQVVNLMFSILMMAMVLIYSKNNHDDDAAA